MVEDLGREVATAGAQLEHDNLVGEELKMEADLLPQIDQEIDDPSAEDDDGELFNPQDIDFNEVERLRTKVAKLESLLTQQP